MAQFKVGGSVDLLPVFVKEKKLNQLHIAGADPGFPKAGGANPRSRGQKPFGQIFLKTARK